MTTKILINAVETEEYRVALVKDGLLDGFHIDFATKEQRVGNLYKGIVERVEPSLQACFVNFGADKNGFLEAGEIHQEYHLDYQPLEKEYPHPPIGKIVKKGQELLVQIKKEMPGRKGAQLTTYISLAGRYLVLMPGSRGGISRKIEDEKERLRLKSIMSELRIPDEVGYIVRTAALKKNKRDLSRDLNRLLRMWSNIKKKVKKAPSLSLIHEEQDIILRTLRDYFTNDVSEILVDDQETFTKVKDYMKIISPRHQRIVKLHKGKRPIFAHHEIETQIGMIYSNKVPLKSGGSVVIDPTEALIAIDVNSGRAMSGKDVETTAFTSNVEAVSEITRQLRLRDLGGLVVIDFIDMKDRKHIREIEKLVREEVKKDRAKIDVSTISKFGLLELSRQRLSPSIESKAYQTCCHCEGRGLVLSVEAASVSFFRKINMGVSKKGIIQVRGRLPLNVANYLLNSKKKELAELESRHGVNILIHGDPAIAPGGGDLEFLKEGNSRG
ncbi:MAG: Rne/Rng family ribonuclease [Desulfatiglans sp.]|jgi:ribonuclease E|nr:Rne/Rng family ribonuclease [Desulfatiglans sp.]